MEAPLPFEPSQTRDWLVSLRDSASTIPIAKFPPDVVYDPLKKASMITSDLAAAVTPRLGRMPPPRVGLV